MFVIKFLLYLVSFRWLKGLVDSVKGQATSASGPNLRRLVAGQQLVVLSEAFVITKIWDYQEADGFRYHEYDLEATKIGGGTQASLEVIHDDGETRLVFFDRVLSEADLGFDASKPVNWPTRFTFEGKEYSLKEQGPVSVHLRDSDEATWSGTFADYNSDILVISIVAYNSEVEVWQGMVVTEAAIQLI